MSVSTHVVQVTARTFDGSAGQAHVTLSFAGAWPSTGLFYGWEYTENAIMDITDQQISDNAIDFDIQFQTGYELGAGTYTDTLILWMAGDPQGNTMIAGSPQTIALTCTVSGPPSTLVSLSPAAAPAGSTGLTLTATGANFTNQSVLTWKGSPLSTTWVNSTRLAATVPDAGLAASGSAQVAVSDGAGGTTGNLPFTIQPPALAITTLTPARVQEGVPGLTLSLQGCQFVPSSLVQWNGSPRPTTFLSPSRLTAQISTADLASPGTQAVTVANPADQGGTSAAVSLVVTAPEAVAAQINPQHTGYIQFQEVTLPAASAWTSVVGNSPMQAPLVAEGKVFVIVAINTTYELLALDQGTGAVAWGPITLPSASEIVYDNDGLFALSSTNFVNSAVLQAFDPGTGSVRWSSTFTPPTSYSAGLAASAGRIYLALGGPTSAALYALDEADGNTAWTQPLGNMALGCIPAVTDDGVYVSYRSWVADYDPATGQQIWYHNTPGAALDETLPVLGDGTLYRIGLTSDEPATTYGAETGIREAGFYAVGPPAVTPDALYYMNGGTLYAADPSSRATLWTFTGDGNPFTFYTAPIVVNNRVFLGSGNGHLYGLDRSSGQLLWNVVLNDGIRGGLAAGDGILVVETSNALTAYLLAANP
jgi:outer membrane protein assembly factor BamB